MRARLLALSFAIVGALASNALATVTASPNPVDLGTVVAGSTATAQTQLLSNTGGVTIQVFDTSACPPGVLSVTPEPVNVPFFSSVTVTIAFTPQTRGPMSCQISMRDTSNQVVGTFSVNGTGIAPAVSEPSSVTFPPTRVIGGVNTQPVTFQNIGDPGTVLQIDGVNISGSAATDFTVTSGTFPLQINAGSSSTIQLQFDPSSAGTRAAVLNAIVTQPGVQPPIGIPLSGIGTTAVINVASPINFGAVLAGTPATQSANVSNTGNGTLTLVGANLTGGAGWITLTACGGVSCGLNTTIPAASSTGLGLRCAPPVGSTGTQSATLTVTSDADPGGNNMATVTCTAVKPDIVVAPAAHTFDFGNVHVGSPATYNMMTISNTGGATLTYSIGKSGPNASDFAISAGCLNACSLPAGGSQTYAITFTPIATGARTATLTITSNDQDVADATIPFALSGTGTQATVSSSPASTIAYGNVLVGTESAPQTLTVTNTGNESLAISSATLVTGATDYLIKTGSTGAQSVGIGASTSWTIACKPSARGTRPGSFRVSNNSGNAPTLTISLSCTGTGPHLTPLPTALDFGTVREGTTQTKTIMLTNDGDTTATIASSTLLPANVGYSVTGVPATLAAGANATMTVTFAPDVGKDGGAATLTINSDAVNAALAIPINGIGQPFGLAVSCPDCAGNPVTMDYGNVRWDQTRSEVFTITNTGDANVTIQSLALSAAGNFTITSPPATPFVLAKGQSKLVTVVADPNDTTLGMFTAKLQVMTDLPPPMMLVERNLVVTSVSPSLTIDPGMMVDFGPVDLATHAPKTIDIKLMNTGDGAMDVSPVPALTGLFTSASQPAQTIAAGASAKVTVSYLPTVEKSAATPDTTTLLVTIDGLISSGNPQPTAVMLTLSGFGADRHIQVGGDIAFPDTYRNPSDADAPVEAVTVHNTGAAPLALSGLMLTGAPEFTLLDAAATTVPGGGSVDLHVRFKPTTDSGTFTGTLAIMDDDTATAMAMVNVTGRAIARSIVIAPAGTIDLGETYVGVPVRLSDSGGALTITNNDATHTIRVRELQVTSGAGELKVVTPDAQTVAPGAAASYDLELTPDAVGDFTGTIQVMLDDDTIPDGTITVIGHGVKGRGSYYACASTSGAGALPVGLALVALGLRRRRRRR